MALYFREPQQDGYDTLSNALSTGLQSYANTKLQKHQREHHQRLFTGLGVHPELAKQLSHASPDMIKQILSGQEFDLNRTQGPSDMVQNAFGNKNQPNTAIKNDEFQPNTAMKSDEFQPRSGIRTKTQAKEDLLMRKEQAEIRKEQRGIDRKQSEIHKERQSQLSRLNKLKVLAQSGLLEGPGFAAGRRRLGLGGLNSTETQLFDDLAKGLIPQGLKGDQLKAFMDRLPHSSKGLEANKALIEELMQELSPEPQQDSQQLQQQPMSQPQEQYAQQDMQQQPMQNQQSEPAPIQAESFPEKLLRNTVSSGAKSISDVANTGKLIDYGLKNIQKQGNEFLEKNFGPVTEPILKNAIESPAGKSIEQAHEAAKELFPKGYLEPKGNIEEFGQGVASLAPSYLLAGGSLGSLPSYLAKAAAGKLAGKVAGKHGGPAAQIATEIAVPVLLNYINPESMRTEFKGTQQKVYEALPKIAGNDKVDATQLKEKMESLLHNATEKSGGSRHAKNISNWLTEYIGKDNKLFLKDLQPLKAKINDLAYGKVSSDQIYKPLSGILSRMAKDTQKDFPEYNYLLKKADTITKLFSESEKNGNFFKKATESMPRSAFQFGYKAVRSLLSNSHTKHARLGVQLARHYPKQSFRYLQNIFKATQEHNQGMLFQNLNHLGKLMEKIEDKSKEKETRPGR